MNILHLFFNDLRLIDNYSISSGIRDGDLFFATIVNEDNLEMGEDFYENSLNFLKENLIELGGNIVIRQGKAYLEILNILENSFIDAIYSNIPRDENDRKRLNSIIRELSNLDMKILLFDDVPTITPYPLINNMGNPITEFREFFYTFMDELQKYSVTDYKNIKRSNDISNWLPIPSLKKIQKAEEVIKEFFENKLINIGDIRLEFTKGSSGLSPYFKYGVISKREIIGYSIEIKEKFPEYSRYCNRFIEKIVMGEFAHHLSKIYSNFSKVHFNSNYYNFEFENNELEFKKWRDGKTGVPIIDAIMRKLKKSGYITYVSRKLTAAFLVQIMHMDWRLGDRYFREVLIDYDDSISSFNWQKISGSNRNDGEIIELIEIEKIYKIIDEDAKFVKEIIPKYKKYHSGDIHLMNFKNVYNGQNMRERGELYLKKMRKIL